MKTLALMPIKKTSSDLPQWKTPADLKQAASIICELGHNLHEHAYLVGKTLLWVQQKVGNRKLAPWVKENVWFKKKTAFRFMAFAKSCDRESQLLEYHQGLKDPDKAKRKPKNESSDPRPPEIRLYFDIVQMIERSFSTFSHEDKTTFIAEMKEVIKQLEKEL